MTSTALQEAQHYADDLALQFEILASNAEQLSHAGTPEAVCYGLSWIHSILMNEILHELLVDIEEIALTLDRDKRGKKDTPLDMHHQGGICRAEKPRKEQA